MSLTDRGRELRTQAAEVPIALIERLGMTEDELETLENILSLVITRAKEQNHQLGSDGEDVGT